MSPHGLNGACRMLIPDKNLSNRFRNMALLCALLVVMIHCVTHLGMTNWFVRMAIQDGFCRIAVPYFFFASGFFLVAHIQEKGWYSREIRKRVRSLLIPYFVFVVSYLLFSLCFDIVQNRFEGATNKEVYIFTVERVVSDLGLNPFCHPVLFPLWYVRALFVLILISPCLFMLAKYLGVWGCVVLLFLYATLGPWEIDLDNVFRKFLSVHGAFYMYLGILFGMGIVNVRIGKFAACVVFLAGLLGLALKVFTQVEGFPHYYYYGFISCPLLLLGLFNLIPDLKIPIWIVTCSFPIYLFHMFVLKAVRGAAVMMGISLNANVLMWEVIAKPRR